MFSFLTGRIDFMEVKQSLADLGLDISKEEAEKILNRLLYYYSYFVTALNSVRSLCSCAPLELRENTLFLLHRSKTKPS